MKTLEDFLEDYTSFSYDEVTDQYAEFLNDVYESIEFAGMVIVASNMKDIDPTMFRCECADWSSVEFEEYAGDYYKIADFEQAESDLEDYEAEQEEEKAENG